MFQVSDSDKAHFIMVTNISLHHKFFTFHLLQQVDGWDLAYLKFCCKVQGIRNERFANEDVCKVVALEEIKGHFPSGTMFEEYWPAKGSIEPVASRLGVIAGNWTQKPAGQPKVAVGVNGYYKLVLWLDKKYNSVAFDQSELGSCTSCPIRV